MLKELILIENQKKYQFTNEIELTKYLLGEEYYKQSKQEQLNQMAINGLLNCVGKNIKVIKLSNLDKENINIENKFIIHDEKTYILSLLLTNRMMLLERIDSNIFTNELDKTNIEENYIIVNTFAKEILNKYVNNLLCEN